MQAFSVDTRKTRWWLFKCNSLTTDPLHAPREVAAQARRQNRRNVHCSERQVDGIPGEADPIWDNGNRDAMLDMGRPESTDCEAGDPTGQPEGRG